MKKIRQKNFTNDELMEMARKYKTVADLTKNDHSLYTMLGKRKLLPECTWLERKINSYTDAEILETAHKYEYLKDFKDENYNMWQSAYSRKLDLSFLKLTVIKWTVETALAEAAKYEYVSEFHAKGKGAFDYLYKKGLLDKCTFKKAVNPYTDNLENVVYGYFFDEQKACYIGRTCHLTDRDWEHRKRKSDTVFKFAKEHGVETPQYVILENGLSLAESSVKEGEWLEKYINDGWTALNKAKTGSIGGLGKKYPKKTVFEHARQFEFTNDYKKAYPLEYAAAYRRGWTKEMTWLKIKGTDIPTHMYRNDDSIYNDKEMCIKMLQGRTRKECYSSKKLVPWYRAANEYGWDEEIFGNKKRVANVEYGYYNDIENVRKAAKPYKTRTEFLKGNPTAYHNALEYEIMDELFPLEKPRHKRGSLTKEKCLEIYVSYGYSKTKLRKADWGVYDKMRKNGWFDEFYPKAA